MSLAAAVQAPARRRAPAQLGWLLAFLTVALTAASLLLLALDRDQLVPPPAEPLWLALLGQVAGPTVSILVMSVLGAVVIARDRRSWLGWTWAATELVLGLALFAQEYAIRGLVVAPGTLPGAVPAAWLQAWLFDLLPLGVLLSLALFPDGRLPGRWCRPLVVAGAAVTVLALLDSLADPYPLSTFVREQPDALPVTMPPALWDVGSAFSNWSGGAVYWAQALMVPAGGVVLLLRFRSSSGDERQQFKWIISAVVLAAAGWLVGYVSDLPRPAFVSTPAAHAISAWGGLVWLLGITIATPVAAGLAVLEYRLYSIDRVINRTLLLGGLAAFITAVYVAIVAGIGSAVDSGFGPFLSLVATTVVAVAFAPVRSRLQALADRLVYGRRATPYEVLAEFADRIGSTYLSEDVLSRMARLLGEGTASDQASVWLRVGSELRLEATWPDPPDQPASLAVSGEHLPTIPCRGRVVAVRDGGELLGALAVTRLPDDWLAPDEDELLRDLARQAGLILRNVRLVEELRSSRARIVKAQDDERRRLQRNLHDGAQQQFVLASLHVGRARHMLGSGRREELEAELEDASEQLLFGLAELRNLARGLHPTIVSLSGLAPALESLADRSQLPVTLESTIERRYPISVESTAYYLVSEALTNATRHACASGVAVRAWEERDRLLVEVVDDGVGGADPSHGSGLRGLEDRVAALGGRFRVESQRGRGTRLMAELRNG